MGKDTHEAACCHTCELFGSGEAPPVRGEATPALEVVESRRMKIVVAMKGGEQRTYVPTAAEVSVGRVAANDIVLPAGMISKRQARFVFKDGTAIVEDTKSACGTYVDGRKITGPTVLHEGATIHMGDFVLRVVTE